MVAEANTGQPRMIDVYRDAIASVEEEVDCQLDRVSGRLPDALRGVLYRNGPGRQELFGIPYGHPFDGDGMVTRFDFSSGVVRYRNRYVRTREWLEERRRGRPLYRSFGTNLPGGLTTNLLRMRFKNAANTSVVHHGGRLMALWEGGLPHTLDPDTLATLRRFDFGGQLLNRHPLERVLAPELPFSAHPKRCPTTGELFNFGMALGLRSRLVLYRLTSGGALAQTTSFTLRDLSFVHDFVLTERSLVFFLPAVAFDVPRTLLGLTTPVDSLKMLDRPMRILVFDRRTLSLRYELQGEPGFFFHFANGYEEDGEISVDGFRLPELPDAQATRDIVEGRDRAFPRAQLVRTRLADGQRKAHSERLFDDFGELPSIDPRRVSGRHRVVFAPLTPGARGDPFLTQLGRFDVVSGERVVRDFGRDLIGEAIFAADGEEEAHGWVLVLCHSAKHGRGELRVLNAQDLSDVAHFALPHNLPPGFHGTYVG